MIKKFVFVLGCFVVIAGSAIAATPATTQHSNTPVVQDGNPFITHKVKSGDTLFGLARKYGVTIAQIEKANDNLSKSLKVGQIVRIPAKDASAAQGAEKTAVVETPKESTAVASAKEGEAYGTATHTVKAGQSLYSIARQHKVTVEDLKKWNNLSTSSVRIGQKLTLNSTANTAVALTNEKEKAGEKSEETATSRKKAEAEATASTVTTASRTANPAAAKSDASEDKSSSKTADYVSKINESGMAEQIDQRADSNKYLALHKTAPVGTIMAVKNPMNAQTVYVRVIGKLPATGENEKVLVKLSKKACQQIGALDKRFRVELSYMP